MKEYWVGVYRRFRHKILYVDGYCKKALVILLTLLMIDLVVLYLIW